jgi:hypothetical protein
MKYLFLILWLGITSSVQATFYPSPFDGVRPTGMGNAFIALADDANTIWYNPAGLADIKGRHLNLLNFVTGYDSQDTLDRLKMFLTNGGGNLLRLGREYLNLKFMPTYTSPNFGISVFSQSAGYFDLSSLLTSGLEAHSYADHGIIVAGAYPVLEGLSIGASMRAFYRNEINLSLSPADILNQFGANPNLPGALLNQLNKGYALGVNLGIKFQVPYKGRIKSGPRLILGATLNDAGTTKFIHGGGSALPQYIKMNFNLGGAFIYPFGKNWKWNSTGELKNFLPLQHNTNVISILNLGTELQHKYFGIRAGVSQGYLSYGFSLEFPAQTRIHFSSYGFEVGDISRASQQRAYMVQVNFGFNPN